MDKGLAIGSCIGSVLIVAAIAAIMLNSQQGESASDFLVKKVYPILTCDQVQKLEDMEPKSAGWDHPNLDNVYNRCLNHTH